jgi:alpha-glucosidase
MVDFHGAYKPTGTQRTYPNQITREGVLGEEYDKFSNRVTTEHDCTLPFTRMLAGPMDYTPGGFLNRSADKWKQALPTQVMGTRCHELAKFVIFDSPLTVACDAPEHYRGQPGIDFLRVVPTVWDDTKVVDGEVGEYILSARRSGADWFLGGMTNHTARTLQLPLNFLGSGEFMAHIYADAPDAGVNAEHLVESRRTVTARDTLPLALAADGGIAIQFKRK